MQASHELPWHELQVAQHPAKERHHARPLATEVYDVQPGDVVLVHSVAGSVGLAFVQIVKARAGCTVIGTTSSRAKAALAAKIDADHVIVFQTDLACIRAKGTTVWLGFASGLLEPFAPHITGLKAVKFIFASATAYSADKKSGRNAKGVREAEQAMAEGKTSGKCLVKVAAN
uniref:Glycerol-1-phosphatase n=1 Tax=Ganoderma boninense TaxID=34458 RepID=A0A5K1K020_9APHY|nr:Glycerol-1-phosphatase [Ganoderma boninense]